ncbi:hypothetical protein MLD38_019806 [Melastoma candidum]|uniref:Uncharacterized protein n=1 Tax=Melastoma candidum TaxID=119954 RepID=A0ACB9QB71_9MYRT|nr:hypothetical protein MLD38_019806 [Melastoma candidum]
MTSNLPRIADSAHASQMADSHSGDDGNRLQEELSYAVLLSDRVRSSINESRSYKSECSEVGRQVDKLSHMLRSLIRLSSSLSASLYERPIRRVVSEVSSNLHRSLSLTRKCKRQNFVRRLCSIISVADFRKLSGLLESSIGDMKWVLSVYDYEGNSGYIGAGSGGIGISLPPIASNDPILAWVWSFIACLHMGQLSDRVEAANELATLAMDNDRNKKIIVEEGGVGPLLKLLKEAATPNAQIAAATALCNLSDDQERVMVIVDHSGVPLIVQVLGDSSMQVQIRVASLVARMAEFDRVAQEEFARENVIRPLVTILSFETFLDEDPVPRVYPGKQSIHSIIQMNKEKERGKNALPKSASRLSLASSPVHSLFGSNKKDRENELPEVKICLKTSCAEAVWMLARDSISNCRKITETKGLLCLAKLVEKEHGKLQFNCLMALVEITAAAEYNADLRRGAFKTNSPAAKAVVDQLLRLINEVDDSSLHIPAIRAIGCLARTFPARETRVILPLVTQLDSRDPSVATEAAISLGKFTCPENFLHSEHSKAIIEFNGFPPLMRLLRGDEDMQLYGLELLCYLTMHASDSEALRQARVLTALEGVDRSLIGQNPKLKELIATATYQLKMYHADLHPQTQYLPALNE